MALQNFWHNGYVTRDLDSALDFFASAFGVRDWQVEEQAFTLRLPTGDETPFKARFALRPGIELVQALSGYQDHVLPYLPADASPRLNHIAYRYDSLEDMRRDIAQSGFATAFEIHAPGIVTIYADARAALGLYVEYLWAAQP